MYNKSIYTMDFEERRSVATEALEKAIKQMKSALKNINTAEEAIYLMRKQGLDDENERISSELAKLTDDTSMLNILVSHVAEENTHQ